MATAQTLWAERTQGGPEGTEDPTPGNGKQWAEWPISGSPRA